MSRMRQICVAAILGAATGVAGAQVETTWNGGTGNWTDSNWTPSIPTAADRAVINSGSVRIDTDQTVDTIVLGLSANLRIYGPGSLTLENDNHIAHVCAPFPPQPNCALSDNSIIDGFLELRNDGDGTGEIIFTTKNHIFEGEGWLEDIKDGGRIEIDPDIRFTNRITDISGYAGIHGSLYIFGRSGGTVDGEFRNEGRVQAHGDQDLTVDAVTKDTAGAEWNVYCGQVMIFKREALTLEGDFSDDPPDGNFESGEFEFEADIWTCGTFTRNGCCGLLFSNDAKFSYATFATGSENCPNPGTSEVSPTDCDDPWTVSTDVTATRNANCGVGG